MPSNRDLSSPMLWRRSLRASHERRLKLARRRRRVLRGRAGVLLAVALSTVAAGGAFAQNAATPVSPGVQSADTVRALQQELGVSADGIYGPRTRAAVKRFQRAHGLTADGIAGPQTLAALGLASPPAAAASDVVGAHAGAHRPVRVGRRPDRGLRRRHLSRQVPVRPRDLAADGRQRRSGRRLGGRAGPHRGQAAGRSRNRAVADAVAPPLSSGPSRNVPPKSRREHRGRRPRPSKYLRYCVGT